MTEIAEHRPEFRGKRDGEDFRQDAERWDRCRQEVERRIDAEHAAQALRDRLQCLKLLHRARALEAEGLRCPRPVPGRIGHVVGLGWFAACVEARAHVSVDRTARPVLEAQLVDHEMTTAGAEVNWWHSLDGHDFDLDDPLGRCSCGARVGIVRSSAEVAHEARKLWNEGFGQKLVPYGARGDWDAAR